MSQADQRRLLITGASSGIGLEACKTLGLNGHRLTLICRTPGRCSQTHHTLEKQGIDPGNLDTLHMDLADLSSVEEGCYNLLEQGQPFDNLVLNAGLQNVGIQQPQYTPQGIELTFAVNHLAHQLIAMRLLPLLLRSQQPRLIITASEVHDPARAGGRIGPPAGLGALQGLRSSAGFTMVDGHSPFNADKAYKDSKLCNVLMAREIARQSKQAGREISVFAWSPGLVIPRCSKGFFRTSRKQNPLGIALFAFVARDLLRLTESLPQAGVLLGSLLTDSQYEQPGFRYFSNRLLRPGLHCFEATETSEEATNMQKAGELWMLCAELIARKLSGKNELIS
ncbi:hypothetical protein OMCYN_01821 [cyanobiont of Ornithocercus magnificus]|nr:hypothetical protein OMCYN_01821 [cyanobiont of Ornithocercus magnificus]